MDFLILNCRGEKIVIDAGVIAYSEMLKNYSMIVKSGKMSDNKNDGFYVDCRGETVHKILDLLPNNATLDDEVLRVSNMLGFDKITKLRYLSSIANKINSIKFMKIIDTCIASEINDMSEIFSNIKYDDKNTAYYGSYLDYNLRTLGDYMCSNAINVTENVGDMRRRLFTQKKSDFEQTYHRLKASVSEICNSVLIFKYLETL